MTSDGYNGPAYEFEPEELNDKSSLFEELQEIELVPSCVEYSDEESVDAIEEDLLEPTIPLKFDRKDKDAIPPIAEKGKIWKLCKNGWQQRTIKMTKEQNE